MSTSFFAGPIGWGYDKLTGNNQDRKITDYFDPNDAAGLQSADDIRKAGSDASSKLNAMSQQAWSRQMEGLQRALASMNNYNGILSHLMGTPGAQNYFDPNGSGGAMSQDPRMAGRPMPPPAAPPPAGATGPATEARRGPGHF